MANENGEARQWEALCQHGKEIGEIGQGVEALTGQVASLANEVHTLSRAVYNLPGHLDEKVRDHIDAAMDACREHCQRAVLFRVLAWVGGVVVAVTGVLIAVVQLM